MSTPISHRPGFNREEPLPGYRTLNLLGRGGYGEVWRAVAPGGLHKAIKIVFGDGGAERTSSEARSLARIKDVRHPMLLSIERIEMVETNLVIVTELADQSLRDCYNAHREAGAAGIPQDELLRYLSDAAEALDFLYQRCSLQHLDVKPENILLLSGRAKVGDFGLIKSLYERSASLVGGLTPTYAPPELFEGKPTRFSDQYSLAILYVQMLTGTLPFSGSNMAEVAAQHLKGVPDLSALPKRQRSVIARSMSKDPNQRFESCEAMVRALRESLSETGPSQGSSTRNNSLGQPRIDSEGAPANGLAAERSTHISSSRGESQDTRPRESNEDSRETHTQEARAQRAKGGPVIHAQPTILVAVGSTGVAVMARLVARLRDRFGRAVSWPNVQILCIDTNAKTLSTPFQADDLSRVHLLPIPLKAAESYGNKSRDYLKWIGRRWFYNIPRNLTTGGFRPLGRLALMSHAARVREAIETVVSESIAGTGDSRETPHVVVCGSIDGGTGSGALIDVVYAIRSALKRRSLVDDQVQGLLMHATPRSNADRDKAWANAYAFLHELYHYSRPGSHYPGEPVLGSKPFHGDNATFDLTHFVRLGLGLSEAEWENAADEIAEFMYASTFTPARDLLHLVAMESNSATSDAMSIHQLDVLTLGAGCGPLLSRAVQHAAGDLTRLWRVGHDVAAADKSTQTNCTVIMQTYAAEAAVRSARFEPAVRQQLAQDKLSCDELLKDAVEVTELEGNSKWEAFVAHLVTEALTTTGPLTVVDKRVDSLLSIIDRYLHCDSQGRSDDVSHDPLYGPVVSRLLTKTRSRFESFLNRLRELVDDPNIRIEGARQHALAAKQLVQEMQQGGFVKSAEIHERGLTVAVALRNPEMHRAEKSRFGWGGRRDAGEAKLRELLVAYADARLHELCIHAVAKVIRVLDAELSTLIEQLDRLSRDLGLLVDENREAEGESRDGQESGESVLPPIVLAYRDMLRQEVAGRRQALAKRVEAELEQRLFNGSQGLQQFLQAQVDLRSKVLPHLQEIAHQQVLQLVEEINREQVEGRFGCSSAAELTNVAQALAETVRKPSGRRSDVVGRMLMIPDLTNPNLLRQQLRELLPDTVVIPGRKCGITLCSMYSPKTMNGLAQEIIDGVETYKELANRLHTRVDVQWTPLSDGAIPRAAPGMDSGESEEWSRTAMIAPGGKAPLFK